MNNKRRETLKKAAKLLDEAYDYVNFALDEEQDCLNNMPENLEASEKYEKIETAVDKLEDATSSIEEAKEFLEDAME